MGQNIIGIVCVSKMGEESAEADWLQQNTAVTFQVPLNFRTRQNRKFGGVWATGEPLTPDPTALARFEVRERERERVIPGACVCPSMVELGCVNTKLSVLEDLGGLTIVVLACLSLMFLLLKLLLLQTKIIC